MSIDTHQHLVPPRYAAWLADRGWHLPIPDWTPDAALATMDRLGIEAALLSVTTPGLYRADERQARALARAVNEYAAGEVARRPSRFGFLATLTLPDVDGAVAEAVYALDDLHADGIVVLAHADGRYLGEAAFAPLYAELDRRAAVLFVHPVFPAGLGPPTAIGNPRSDVDLLHETTRSAVDLVASGTLARFPRLRVILSHAGGYLPYMAHRVAAMVAPDGSYAAGLDVLRQFYFDTALSSAAAPLAALLAFAAPGHVLYGTDWPYVPPAALDHFENELAAYPFTAAQRESVRRGAAGDLFPRLLSP